MGATILQVKKKDIPLDWLGVEERTKSPDVIFRVSIEEVKQPSYVKKEYPERVKRILENAKAGLKEKKKKGYTREQAFEDLFKVQEKIAKHIKGQECK